MKLLTIENKELRLSSNLDEYAFGKTNYNSIIGEEGLLFDGKNFLQWSFDDVKSYPAEKNGEKQNLVFYCAENPLSDKVRTLAELLEEGGEKSCAAALAVCRAITLAAQNGNEMPLLGAGGILVDLEDSTRPETARILFIPEKLFEYSANSLPQAETLAQRTGWLNETLKGLPALCFERASIVYKLLSGQLPFSNPDPVERNSDLLDKNFLPLEYCINGIDSELAYAVNSALKLNSNLVSVPGKKIKGKANEDLSPEADFPLEKINEAWKLSQEQAKNGSNQDFEEKVAAYKKARQSKIKTKRGLRRNSTAILASIAAAAVLAIIITHTVKTRLDDYTSIGLTSTQTIQAYMKGINEKDVAFLSDLSAGKAPKAFTDTVSRIYVMHKQRLSYANDNGFAYPSNWLFYITNASKYLRSGVYGITNLSIDGKALPAFVEVQKRNQMPKPLTKEGDVSLQDGSTSVHKVEYYVICTEGEEVDFTVQKYTDIFTLTFKKDCWVISDIQSTEEMIPVDCGEFKEDYFDAVRKAESDVIKATESLRSKYSWLPEKDAMQREKERIDYELAHPYAILGF